jgi:predicted HAD superfamily hydrolase
MTSNITQTNNLRLHPLFYISSQKHVQGEFIKRGTCDVSCTLDTIMQANVFFENATDSLQESV